MKHLRCSNRCPLQGENHFTLDSPIVRLKKNTSMKKISMFLLASVLLFSVAPVPTLKAEPSAISSSEKTKKEESEEAKVIIARIEAIKALDKSDMTRSQKKELRQEVKALKTTLGDLGNGIYLSAGAIIIILLLLILIL